MNQLRLALFCLLILIMQNINAQEAAPIVVLNHQALYVRDLKKSGDFYRNIIGLQQIDEPFKIGKHIWLKTGPKTALHLILGATEKKEYYKNHHMCFSVSSLQSFIKKLNDHQIAYEDAGGKKSSISKRPDGIQQIWIQDPDGYWIEINNDSSSF